jgi:hypothetical protein
MPVKKIYQCVPCNFEYEYVDFGMGSLQAPVPPCPLCSKTLTYDAPELVEDYTYQCWKSEGGCGIVFSVEHLYGKAPETYPCPMCGVTAKAKPQGFSIVHGKSTTKGASIDVAIGRSAEERWNKVIDRKSVRDKIRKESGTQALTATGRDEYQPLKGGQLKVVAVPDSKVNKG